MSEQLGSKIKQLREAANLSLEQLGEQTHIDSKQLGLIERASLTPPMSTIVALARALNVRPGTLLDGEEPSGLEVHSPEFHPAVAGLSRHGEGARDHIRISSLAPRKVDRNMDPMMLRVGYVAPDTQVMSSHEGEEFIYVLEGQMELRYGSEIYELRAGESLYYDSLVPHCLSAPTPDAPMAKVLIVMYTPY